MEIIGFQAVNISDFGHYSMTQVNTVDWTTLAVKQLWSMTESQATFNIPDFVLLGLNKDVLPHRWMTNEASCWGFGNIRFPFFLGGARWLAFPKQVYALLLLPYVIPYMVLSYTTAILLAAWSILFTKCCWSLTAFRMPCFGERTKLTFVTWMAVIQWDYCLEG